MYPLLIKTKNLIFDILFPPLCLNCQKYILRGNFICDDCLDNIHINSASFCPVCKKRLPESKICRHGKKYSYILAAAGNYGDPILQELIHCFKYKNFQELAPILGNLLTTYLKNIIHNSKFAIHDSIIVSIPLHHSRERIRGYNQSKLLAKFIGKNLNLEITDTLKRTKNTKPQINMDREERSKNIFGCFKIENPEIVRGKNIILIDDVYTSGATMDEAVKILKQNGAKRIIALVLAKA